MGVSNAVSIGKSFIPTAGAGSASAVNPKLNSVNGSNPNNVNDFETLLPTLLDY